MTSEELLKRLSDEMQTTDEEVRSVMASVVQNMCDQLAQGNQFTIPDLGAFTTVIKEKRRIFDNEAGGDKIMPPERVVDFKVHHSNDDNQIEGES